MANREQNWDECLASFASGSIRIDVAKARSLLDTAKARQAFLEPQEITESSANFLFENYYTCILEIMHAIVLSEGFNVSNHICLGFYLRDIIGDPSLYREFDGCRYKRNSLTYYGKRMDFEVAKEAVEKSKGCLSRLYILLDEKLKR
ncbi:hypothetical protein HOC01_04385 [archaeon]|nr:hypothetical protein [archaeon]MBT6698350.1 hypothetical protein [archaeon]